MKFGFPPMVCWLARYSAFQPPATCCLAAIADRVSPGRTTYCPPVLRTTVARWVRCCTLAGFFAAAFVLLTFVWLAFVLVAFVLVAFFVLVTFLVTLCAEVCEAALEPAFPPHTGHVLMP